MLKRLTTVITIATGLLLAQNGLAILRMMQSDFAGTYALYGGYRDELAPPVAGDVKIAFDIKGTAAKELFNAIGVDRQEACPAQQRRLRRRDMLLCVHSKRDGYRCQFGFDLSTGLSIGGLGTVACN